MTRSKLYWAACAVLTVTLTPYAASSHPVKQAKPQIPQSAVAEVRPLQPGFVTNGNACAPGVAIPAVDAYGAALVTSARRVAEGREEREHNTRPRGWPGSSPAMTEKCCFSIERLIEPDFSVANEPARLSTSHDELMFEPRSRAPRRRPARVALQTRPIPHHRSNT